MRLSGRLVIVAFLLVASAGVIGAQAAVQGKPKKVTADQLKLKLHKPSKKYKIAFVLGASEGTYFAALRQGARKAQKSLGVDVFIVGPTSYDAAQQASVIDTILAKKPDFMVVQPVDATTSIPPLQKVHQRGIQMVTVDTVIGNGTYGSGGKAGFPLTYVGSDNYASGVVGCRELATELKGKGKVYIQDDVPGDSGILARRTGCQSVLKKYPNIKVVARQYGNEDPAKAQQQTSAVLTRFPDLAGIYSDAGPVSEGAAKALRAAGKSGLIKLVAMDSTAAVIQSLKHGDISAVIAQNPRLMGELGVKIAVAYLEGQRDLPTFVDTSFTIVTRANLSKFKLSELTY